MARQMIVLVLVLVLAMAVAGLLWARSAPYGQTGGKAASAGKMMPAQNEYSRCTKTCSALMDYYHKQYAKMKTHEADKTCWSNCWTRYGKGKSASTSDEKNLWTSRMAQNMRANQCAQACWRSEPRSNTVCYR